MPCYGSLKRFYRTKPKGEKSRPDLTLEYVSSKKSEPSRVCLLKCATQKPDITITILTFSETSASRVGKR
jgi:hypothetical protein